MAGRGPAPKDPSKLHPRSKVEHATTIVAEDGELRGPDLPEDALPAGQTWHVRTVAWWRTWRSSPQAQTFTATDWDFLLDTALMHHTMWALGKWEFASELRLRAAKFGATPEDRMRLRMQVAPSQAPAEGAATQQASTKPTRYAHLRVAKDA